MILATNDLKKIRATNDRRPQKNEDNTVNATTLQKRMEKTYSTTSDNIYYHVFFFYAYLFI
ncbi:MAG: hypothetical protein LBF90_07230 [Prevotellaceae bacterium]|jgi:hypothetical protein|nr:hypothetical protein [Prevotellaceae bacterium]